jgi:S-DNA-T family DNA segregation ATPase FtsK/SpoIIIE
MSSATYALLPSGALDFLKRRTLETAGTALVALSCTLLIALIGFSPGDPSFNHATDAAAHNLLGIPGAYIADLLLHVFGLAGLVPVAGLAAWGWRLLRKHRLNHVWLHALALITGMVLLAIALSVFPAPPSWPFLAGPGGAVGGVLLDNLSGLFSIDYPAASRFGAALVALVVGLPVVGLALGLPPSDWKLIAAALRRAWSWLVVTARRLIQLMPRRSTAAAPTRVASAPASSAAPVRRAPLAEPVERAAPGPDAEVVIDDRASRTRLEKRVRSDHQGMLDFNAPLPYKTPPLDLLREVPGESGLVDTVNRAQLEANARHLKTVLDDFGVRGDIVKVRPGPVVTLYELEPAPGTKSSRVIALADDIARSMSAVSARVAVVAGRNAIGIELPNDRRETVSFRELVASDAFERYGGALTLPLGKDIGGAPVFVDLTRMPHLLIAGTTGSGKSVAINAMILGLLYRLPPDVCKLILIDPKMLELSVYDGIPHLLSPVVTEPSKAVVALKWTVREMEERYRLMSQIGVRNIAGFNSRVIDAKRKGEDLVRRVQTGFDDEGQPVFEEQSFSLEPLPLIVVVVDEMADLMLVAGKDIEAAVQRLSQMARAAGIHLIMATQRPSVDVITGTIKANFPTRISFHVTSKIDSRTILGEQGAEQLLGQGDMLFMATGGRVTRVHGPFVSDEEVEAVVRYLKSQGDPRYIPEVTEGDDDGLTLDVYEGGEGDDGDELYREAVEIVSREGKASTSFVQRRLQIGYNRAARLIERMEAEGLVSKADRVGRREIRGGGESGD